ncbi:MAG: phytanoyl-CoA dioxygenase family protein [Hyphomicrobiaceae bacterium]
MTPLAGQMQELEAKLGRDGYVTLPNVVSKTRLAALADQLRNEFNRAKAAGELFSGGGMISGHLNCFPGAQSRFVYDELDQHGVFDLVRKISPAATRMPNIGCNLNLPNSGAQNPHVDGYAATAFFIVNVAPVDTDIENGAMEVTPGTHVHEYKYWQYALSGKPAIRMRMSAGDVVIRSSVLWHRGMPNVSRAARPMLAFTWENGGSELADPYTAHGGQITFLTNRYSQNLSDRIRERAFTKLPALGTGYLFMRSLFQ